MAIKRRRVTFWDNINKFPVSPQNPKGCWLWTGKVNKSGYGYYTFYGKIFYAHRSAYSLTKGPIRHGWEIDHKCCVRLCCNPLHLEQVTPRENKRRIYDRKPHQGV